VIGLYSFTDYVQPEVVGDADDAVDEICVPGRRSDLADERFVDLQTVEWEVSQVADLSYSAAEL
jgi:hypothetical protein